MTATLRLGYVPLLDAAPIIVADALGFAQEEGLRLALHAAPGWAGLRDMLALGQVDAAQMLAPVPVAIALGLARSPVQFEALAAGDIDVFCVGEPWGSMAVEIGAGALLLPCTAIWAAAPEKVLAVRAGWATAEPDLAGRLLRSVWRAGRWLGHGGNHMMAAEVLTAPGRLAVPPDLVERALTGRMLISTQGEERHTPGLIEFFAGAATFPWRSQAAWIGTRLARRHGLDPGTAANTASAVFRSDLYRQHLRAAGADLPGASDKLEGALDAPMAVAAERGQLILHADRFFDAAIFDPGLPMR